MSEAGDAGQRLKQDHWAGEASRQWREQRGFRIVPFERAFESLKSRSRWHRPGNEGPEVGVAGEKMNNLNSLTH